uniref:Activin_recp domain-containing protein n=1 Tax=Caenorhabditis tropicalis TaxID=1561998 RepID=A0A1I7UN34_9PELO
MTRLQKSLGFFLLFSCLVTKSSTLKCYNTGMQTDNCEAIDLWCIKFINGSDITRGCANTYDFCSDEDPGCYPEREENGVTQKWCCCSKNMCNSVSSHSIFLTLFTFLSTFWVFS